MAFVVSAHYHAVALVSSPDAIFIDEKFFL